MFKLSHSLYCWPRFKTLWASLQNPGPSFTHPSSSRANRFHFCSISLALAEHGVTDTPLGSAPLERHGSGSVFTRRRSLFAQSHLDQIVPNTENKQRPVNVHNMTQHAGGSRGERKVSREELINRNYRTRQQPIGTLLLVIR